MVYSVCHTILRHHQDAEDAMQATFIVLAKSARRVRWRRSLANWLYGVARRVSLKAISTRSRARECELLKAEAPVVEDTIAQHEDAMLLQTELARLPSRYRSALVLCYLEGRSREDAAAQLGCSVGAVKGRLERAREQLRQRLTPQGVALPVALVTAGIATATAQAAVSPALIQSTVQAATTSSGSAATAAALQLARGELIMAKATMAAVVALTALGVGIPAGIAMLEAQEQQAPPALADFADDARPLTNADAIVGSLPPDGAWARYEVTLRREAGGDVATEAASITLSSVGQTEIEGKPARWIEMMYVNDGTSYTKVLIPEEAFKGDASPINSMVRGWKHRNSETPTSIDREAPTGLLHSLFPGRLKEAKRAASREFEVGSKSVAANGIVGTVAFDETNEALYKVWSNPEVPFGTVSMELEETSPNRSAERRVIVLLKEFGNGAKSAMPDRK